MDSVNCKANRAIELLKQLNAEVEQWKASEPYQVLSECNVERTKFVVGIRITSEPDGLRWSLLAGEILFNLRCALDHLVYAWAVADTGSDPPPDAGGLMFPIS